MASSIPVFGTGVLLGLGAAVPIGPVNVQIARLALRNGFVPGFALGCGAVTVDVIYALLTTLGIEHVARNGAVRWSLTLCSIVLLTHLGLACLAGERQAWRSDPVGGTSKTTRPGRAYLTGLLMTLLNPMTLAFWFIAVPAVAGPVGDGDARNLAPACIGVFVGTVSWVVFFAGGLALAGRFRRNWWLPLADAAGGAAMLVFAAAALLSSLRAFL